MARDPLFPADDRPFRPPHCPHEECPSRKGTEAFTWTRKGRYVRACDGRTVQRFRCRTCGRRFSEQTFRLSFGLRRPELTKRIFESFVSKVTMRQSARILKCSRKTVHQRLELLARHSVEVHEIVLARAKANGGLPGDFQLDELESFEGSRRLQPVTMPVLVELHKRFVVHVAVGTLPARGRLSKRDLERKAELEAMHGKRVSESNEVVAACFRVLKSVVPANKHHVISTDRKSSYPKILRGIFRPPYTHARHSSTAPRTPSNPLFPVNHTLGMLRDGVSRIVRRTWGSTKKRARFLAHTWIWVAYRNYLRPLTNKAHRITSAVALGVASEVFTATRFLTWRPLPLALQVQPSGPVSVGGGEIKPPAHSPSSRATPD